MKKFYTYLKSTFLFAIVLVSINAQAQSSGSLSGTITTSDGKAAEAVHVFIKELNRGAITSENGTFSIKNIKAGTYTVKSGGVGLAYQEKSITVIAGQNSALNFTLTENSQKLTEVVVTGYKSVNQRPVSAGKVAIKPLDNPQMVQVIGSQVIADQQINRLSDVIKNVNGVNLGSTRGGVQETFYARGYNMGATNIFKNGSRVSSGVIPEASTLESVEILKGSSALLYGNVTSGAVLNMVTKQPKYNFGGEVSMRSGSYGFYKPTVDVYGPITKKLAFRMVGTGEEAESFRKNVKSDRIYVNPSLLYKFSDKTSLLVQGDYLKYNNTPDFGIGSMKQLTSDGEGIARYIIPTVGRSSFYNTNWAYNKANQTTASANLNHELNNNWKISSIISYQEYDRNTFGAERIQAEANGDYNRALARAKSNEKYYNGQINITGVFKTGALSHNLLVGTDAEQFTTIGNTFAYANKTPLSVAYDMVNLLDPSLSKIKPEAPEIINTFRSTAPVYRFGYYAQDLIEVTSKFKVLAGLRWTYQKTALAKSEDLFTGAVTNTQSKYDRAFSPKLGLVYQPLTSTSIFASYSNNFAVNTGMTIDLQSLEPSIIDQYEVGVKNDFLNGKLSANVSAYRIYNNKTYVANATNSTYRELGGETTSDGVELDVNGTIIPGMNFIAGYSYNYIRYTKTTGLKNSYVTGERLVGTAANTANGTLFYTLRSGKLRGVKLGASANYVGKRNGGWNNQNDPGKVWTNNPAQNNRLNNYDRLVPLSAYTTVDLSAGYSLRGFSLLAKLSNITNELNYIVHENYSVNPIAPRQLVTTLTYKF
jgi:iron complex outermembrane recepter protein